MKPFKRFALCLALLLASISVAAEEVRFTIVHISDVHELTPVAGDREGGMARLATLRKMTASRSPNTYVFLAGDAFSPSALGTAIIDGKPLAGKQAVSILNALGLDYATFGNHEFDISEADFKARLHESKTTWISGNVLNAQGQPFEGVPRKAVFSVTGAKGAKVRVGMIGVTIDQTQKPWVKYLDAVKTASEQAKALRPQVDVLLALTHLSIEQDQQLAKTVPEIDMIMGGHEHENIRIYRGADFTPIYKADANVRSAYIHDLAYDTDSHHLAIESSVRRMNSEIAEDPAMAKLVSEWVTRAFDAFRKSGFEPTQVVAQSTEVLDGKEASVRTTSTKLTELIAEAVLHEVPDAIASFYNSGSIRIDDELLPGAVTQYDIIRILPFGGKIVSVDMKGSLLERVLNAGTANHGKGGWLQMANLSRTADGAGWLLNNQPLEMSRTYRIATTDFLLTGGERGMEFLTRDNPEVSKIVQHRDIRFSVIAEMQKRWPVAASASAH